MLALGGAEPSDATSGMAEEPISAMATVCEGHFAKILLFLTSNGLNAYATILRGYEKRFVNWTAYLGVFAGGQGSLDQRLKHHLQYRDLVLLTLDMLKMNLTQMTAEPSEPSSDESSDEEPNRREIELDGIQKSLNELDRFAIHIRQASTSSLDARVKAFGAKRPEQVSSFEIRATFTVNSLYPDAPEELRKHLSSLMTHRYTKLLYWQSHDKKLRSDRRRKKRRSDLTSRAVHDSAHRLSKEGQAQEVSKPQVYEKSMSGTHASELRSQLTAPPANIHMEVTIPTSRRAGASTVIGGGARFPDPPVFEEGEHLKPCPLCRKIFLRADYEDSLWWKGHVNADLLPFSCVLTKCSERPSFARRSTWKDHTKKCHQNVGKKDSNEASNMQLQGGFTDRCPICCRKLDESDPKATYSTHHSTLPISETSHDAPNTVPPESMLAEEKSEGLTKRVRFAQQEHHSAGETGAEQGTGTESANLTKLDSPTINSAADLMMRHIATHLQSLALLTPRLASSEFEEGETRNFASSKGLSSSRTSGQRSTIADDTNYVDFGDADEPALSPGITPQVNESSDTEPPVRETSDATEPMNWGDLLSATPYDEEEDNNIHHMKKTKISELNRLFSALLNWVQAPDYSIEAEASDVIQSQRSRLLDIQRSGGSAANRSIAFCSAANEIPFETLQSFFNKALSLQSRGQHNMLVDYCAEQVWISHSYQDEESIQGRHSASNSRRILFSLLVLADRPLDVLWFVKSEITDMDIPLSRRTLRETIPPWTEKEISYFTILQNLPAPNNVDTVNIVTSNFHARDGRHDDFIRYVDQNLQEGLDGEDHRAKFISPSITQAWWKKAGENRILHAVDYSIHGRPATILNGYLNIFSILVYIGRTSLINWFIRHNCQDQQLPILDPLRFGNDPTLVEMITEFCNIQWMFCPIIFSSDRPMDKRSLDRRQILPIKHESRKTSKAHNPKSIIRVVTLHPGCYDQTWSPTGTVVFKEYRTREKESFRDSWNKEYNAFVSIESCDHIVQYLGSFEQNDRCFMILEYASEGSLDDLFNRDARPITPEQRMYFLLGLMGLTKAINKIQNLGGGPSNQRAGFAHRDINPANILVFPGDNGLFTSGFRMKLADFDTATPIQVIGESRLTFQDNDGNRTYCAPEASRIYEEQEKDLKQVSVSSDVWSLGCVISESVVWMAGGMAALEAAVNDRKLAIKRFCPAMVGSGFDKCFHNYFTVHSCVLKSHRAAIDVLRGSPSISRGVCNLVELHMLVPMDERGDPMTLWYNFEKMFNDLFANPTQNLILNDFTNTRPFSDHPQPALRPSTEEYGAQPGMNFHQRTDLTSGTLIQVRSGSNHAAKHQNAPNVNTGTSSGNVTPMDLPSPLNHPGHAGFFGLEQSQDSDPWRFGGFYGSTNVDDVVNHRRDNGKRDTLDGYRLFCQRIHPRHFIFIIDDSDSMRVLGAEVLKVIRVLVWLVKNIDSTGVEIRFTSNSTKRYPSTLRPRILQTTEKIIDPVRHWLNTNEAERSCNMEHSLDKIFADPKIVDPKRPTSVLILTTGIWEGGPIENSGVQASISSVLKQMEVKGVPDAGFTFQFVSFGNDPNGLRRLRYLDDDAQFPDSKRNNVDIVDHKSSTANVWAILTGAVSEMNEGYESAM